MLGGDRGRSAAGADDSRDKKRRRRLRRLDRIEGGQERGAEIDGFSGRGQQKMGVLIIAVIIGNRRAAATVHGARRADRIDVVDVVERRANAQECAEDDSQPTPDLACVCHDLLKINANQGSDATVKSCGDG